MGQEGSVGHLPWPRLCPFAFVYSLSFLDKPSTQLSMAWQRRPPSPKAHNPVLSLLRQATRAPGLFRDTARGSGGKGAASSPSHTHTGSRAEKKVRAEQSCMVSRLWLDLALGEGSTGPWCLVVVSVVGTADSAGATSQPWVRANSPREQRRHAGWVPDPHSA